MTADQNAYWRERHERYRGDPRAVGNLGASPEQHRESEKALRSTLNAIAYELQPLASVLDVGCGHGRTTAAFTALGYEYTGVDVSPVAIELARQADPRGEFIVADFISWSPGHSYDVVAAIYVLSNFVKDDVWRNAVMKALSLVNVGGVLVVADNFPELDRVSGDHFVARPLSDYAPLLEAAGLVEDAGVIEEARGRSDVHLTSVSSFRIFRRRRHPLA